MKKLKYLLSMVMILAGSLVFSQGYTRISSQLKQKNDLSFALLDSYDLLGGAVSGLDRTTFPLERRKQGMLFLDQDDNKVYQLQGGINNENWQIYDQGGKWLESENDIYYLLGNVAVGMLPYPNRQMAINSNLIIFDDSGQDPFLEIRGDADGISACLWVDDDGGQSAYFNYGDILAQDKRLEINAKGETILWSGSDAKSSLSVSPVELGFSLQQGLQFLRVTENYCSMGDMDEVGDGTLLEVDDRMQSFTMSVQSTGKFIRIEPDRERISTDYPQTYMSYSYNGFSFQSANYGLMLGYDFVGNELGLLSANTDGIIAAEFNDGEYMGYGGIGGGPAVLRVWDNNYVSIGLLWAPTEKFEVDGNIKVSTGNAFYIGNDRFLSGDGYNVCVGHNVGNGGLSNVFIGQNSGTNLISGSNNTFVGRESGELCTTSNSNVYIGSATGYYNLSGSLNTFVGTGSGFNNTGSNNTYLGRWSGHSSGNGSNNIFIGHMAGYFETGSDKLYIDNSDTSDPLIGGDFASNKVTINDVLILKPRATLPTSPTDGEIYVNSADKHIYCYLDSVWKQLD